jgi:secreted PhoX family phosphatase
VLKASGAAALSALAGASPSGAAAADADTRLIRDPHRILDLPEGFSYRIVQRFGERMSDGYRVPGKPDAMGCFPGPDGSIILMRNHEVAPGSDQHSPYFAGQARPVQVYDPEGTGGVTRLVLDAATLELKRSNLVLAGTYWNCAGGLSPWGWLSCEETVDDPRHGYVFLCATDAERVRSPKRLAAYGRMRHEAAAVDPRTLFAYMTEDRPDGCFYRFVPDKREQPFRGSLQALRIAGQPGFDTGAQRPGTPLPVDWVEIEQPDSADDSVRSQGRANGAARVQRGEGLWLADNQAFFCATAGGPLARGQIFRLSLGEKPTLEVVAEASDADVLDMPDNLCVSPHGQLYVAEDGPDGNFLRRVSLDGRVLPFARNAVSQSEFAGPCFSPDGRTLFVNIQHDHLTLAIRGPFERPLAGERGPQATRSAAPNWSRGARGLGVGLTVLALAALAYRRRRQSSTA